MIRRVSEQLVMRPDDVKPSRDDFSVLGVFNPGVVKVNNEIVLLARVAEKPMDQPGFVGLPRLGPEADVVVDWVPQAELDQSDCRVVRRKKGNLLRLTSISHLRVFRSRDGRSTSWTPGPQWFPELPCEAYGIEDPRITEIEGKYWITYVAISPRGVATALASTEDFETFERHGVIFPPENKDIVLFAQKVSEQYVAIHRPNPNSQFGRPQMWVARSPDLLHWGRHECLYSGCDDWESDKVGAGAPPLAVDEGWLEIYHGVRRSTRANEVGAYSAGALLLDRDDPTHVLKRSRGPIMQPSAEFERTGFVQNVVFPTALIECDDLLQLYYGAADACIGVVEFSKPELLEALE
jgi:predicted GH43/DUF377 family glycosyl hydrolase